MQEFDEIWDITVAALTDSTPERQAMSHTYVNYWFKNTKIVQINSWAVVVYCPTKFASMTLFRAAETVGIALSEILGYTPKVFFTDEIDYRVSDEIPEPEPEPEPEPVYFSTAVESEKVRSGAAKPKPMPYDGYTFDNFIVGQSNKFAHSVALSVATNPACIANADSTVRLNNPLFIYGPSGLGKTHLLYAIINKISTDHPSLNIIYVKGEEFTNQMIESISKNKTAEFRERYRTADVLLIDDIHFIAGKESTQEEFFHTFNDLYEHKKQIILTSDRPARDIQHLEERLRTRFEWGMPADIQPPDFELRVAIMANKAKIFGVHFSNEVISFLAEKLTNNVRQMEGAIKRIIAFSSIEPTLAMDVASVNRWCQDFFVNNDSKVITPQLVTEKVLEKYGVDRSEFFSKSRTGKVVKARHVAAYIMRKELDLPYEKIGEYLKRDHSSVMNSVKTVTQLFTKDSSFEVEITELIKDIKS
jgi:chromosomal replication initiator protein